MGQFQVPTDPQTLNANRVQAGLQYAGPLQAANAQYAAQQAAAAQAAQQPAAAAPYGLSSMPQGEDPAFQNVDPNELVSNQLNGLLGDNSQYIDYARAQGEQQAASRGLLNSSMAAGSAENAAIGAALPIAQGNAQQYAQVGASNQQAWNQFTGERIAADAQTAAANAYASAQRYSANINLQEAQMSNKLGYANMAQQFQEYGMGLGEQYAQMGQQGQEFAQQLQQNNSQFLSQQNNADSQFMANMDFQKYSLGMSLQNNNQQEYANMFGAIMMNPNMTATDRSSALGNAQSFFGQMSQQNAALPAFTPPWMSDSNYWATDWSQGTNP